MMNETPQKGYMVTDAHPGKYFAVTELTNYELDVVFEAFCFLYNDGMALEAFLKANDLSGREHMYIFDRVRQYMGYN